MACRHRALGRLKAPTALTLHRFVGPPTSIQTPGLHLWRSVPFLYARALASLIVFWCRDCGAKWTSEVWGGVRVGLGLGVGGWGGTSTQATEMVSHIPSACLVGGSKNGQKGRKTRVFTAVEQHQISGMHATHS